MPIFIPTNPFKVNLKRGKITVPFAITASFAAGEGYDITLPGDITIVNGISYTLNLRNVQGTENIEEIKSINLWARLGSAATKPLPILYIVLPDTNQMVVLGEGINSTSRDYNISIPILTNGLNVLFAFQLADASDAITIIGNANNFDVPPYSITVAS